MNQAQEYSQSELPRSPSIVSADSDEFIPSSSAIVDRNKTLKKKLLKFNCMSSSSSRHRYDRLASSEMRDSNSSSVSSIKSKRIELAQMEEEMRQKISQMRAKVHDEDGGGSHSNSFRSSTDDHHYAQIALSNSVADSQPDVNEIDEEWKKLEASDAKTLFSLLIKKQNELEIRERDLDKRNSILKSDISQFQRRKNGLKERVVALEAEVKSLKADLSHTKEELCEKEAEQTQKDVIIDQKVGKTQELIERTKLEIVVTKCGLMKSISCIATAAKEISLREEAVLKKERTLMKLSEVTPESSPSKSATDSLTSPSSEETSVIDLSYTTRRLRTLQSFQNVNEAKSQERNKREANDNEENEEPLLGDQVKSSLLITAGHLANLDKLQEKLSKKEEYFTKSKIEVKEKLLREDQEQTPTFPSVEKKEEYFTESKIDVKEKPLRDNQEQIPTRPSVEKKEEYFTESKMNLKEMLLKEYEKDAKAESKMTLKEKLLMEYEEQVKAESKMILKEKLLMEYEAEANVKDEEDIEEAESAKKGTEVEKHPSFTSETDDAAEIDQVSKNEEGSAKKRVSFDSVTINTFEKILGDDTIPSHGECIDKMDLRFVYESYWLLLIYLSYIYH